MRSDAAWRTTWNTRCGQAARPALLVLALITLCSGWLASCDLPGGQQTVTLATLFPTTGPDSALGAAMTRAVDLAISQNASPGAGYTLTVTHLAASANQSASAAAENPQVVGVVGPLDSQTAVATLPTLARAGIVTLSPAPMSPGLGHADQAAAEGLDFARFHPRGQPNTFFRLAVDDATLGRAAADLALAPPQTHGLGAPAIFVVDDGSLSGKAQAAAVRSEVNARGGAVTGSASIAGYTAGSGTIEMQKVVSAIIRAEPGAVFYAGDLASGAALRRTLSLTGAPQLMLLVAGAAADDPTWSATVGAKAVATATTGLASAPDLASLPSAAGFVAAYHHAYPGAALTPLSALAYDAAMDEISAIKSLIAAGKSVTRAAVLGIVASASYAGVTGRIAFNASGDPIHLLSLAVYACDFSGVWRYQAAVPPSVAAG